MNKIFLICFLLTGCNFGDNKDKIKNLIGRHEFDSNLTTPDLLEQVKDDPPVLFLYQDETFEIKSKRKYCFSNVKGSWGIGKDFEREIYFFELKNCKTNATPGLIIPVNCDKYKGQLGFRL